MAYSSCGGGGSGGGDDDGMYVDDYLFSCSLLSRTPKIVAGSAHH